MLGKMREMFGLGKGSTFKSDRLEDELIRAMEEEKLSFLGKKYAPSRYSIHCNSDEHQRILLLEKEFRAQYEDFLKERIEKKKYLLAGTGIELQLEVDEDLEPGEYRVEAFLDKVPQEEPVEEKPDKQQQKRSVGKDGTVVMKREKEKPKAEDAKAKTGTKVMPRAKLTLISGSEKVEHRITKSEVMIGRDGDIALFDPKEFVSSRHFQLTLRGTDYWIKDLDSTNGTEVNEQFITEQKLEEGDIIRVGEIELKFSRR